MPFLLIAMHIYRSNRTGELLPSVSYVHEATRPEAENIRFAKARDKRLREGKTEKDLDNHRDAAAQRGTLLHAYGERVLEILHTLTEGSPSRGKEIEKYLTPTIEKLIPVDDIPPEILEDANRYLYGYNAFIKDLTERYEVEVVANEMTVINESKRYGGRIDFILKIKGLHQLFDIKTKKPFYNQWKRTTSYEMDLFRKPKYRTKDKKKIPIEERPEQPGWDWCNPFLRDYFLKTNLYLKALKSMNYQVDGINILLLREHRYQPVRMTGQMWVGCNEECDRRIELFWKTKAEKWLHDAQEHLDRG